MCTPQGRCQNSTSRFTRNPQVTNLKAAARDYFYSYLGVDLLGMFQDADDISHHLNAHVIQDVLKGVCMWSKNWPHIMGGGRVHVHVGYTHFVEV